MTSEQLQSVRAERWRQKTNPVLTAEDAKAWIEDIGLCLFLPRRAQFLAAAPSFVEAAMGAPSEAPGREAIENATVLLRRLAADAAVVPLNLFGNFGSDQPDFLASRATLPYVFSLIGGRNWKSGPGGKASPLMTEIWTLLNDGEARTAAEIQATLGRELTEAAVLRGLAELWNGLRAIPVYEGEATRWELTQARFAAEMAASQKVAQTTALSALVSLYLDGAVAASPEEIETFLSPLAARSRVREVVNGLSATRQLGLVSVGAQPLLHVAGALPEFAEEEAPKPEAEPRRAREERAERKTYERGPRPARAGAGERRAQGEGREFRERRERAYPKREFGDKRDRPYPKREFGDKRDRPYPKREFADKRERPAAGEGRYPKRKFGEGAGADRERPWRKREERPAEGEGRRPFRERRDDERGNAGKKFGGGKKFGKPEFGGREKSRFSRETSQGEGRPQGRGGEKFGQKPRFFRERQGEGRPPREGGPGKFGAGKKFGGREYGGREKPRFFREKPSEGEGRPKEGKFGQKPRSFRERAGQGEGRSPREGGPGKFGGGKKFGGREYGGREKPRFFRERSAEGEGRPERERGGKPGAGKGKAGFGKSGKPAFRGEGKRGFGKERKPFGKPDGKGPGRSGKPAFGKSKPGGFKPPFRKGKKKEGEE